MSQSELSTQTPRVSRPGSNGVLRKVPVSDIGMPELDGYALIREVRARGYSYQSLPAIALTALALPEDRRRALADVYWALLNSSEFIFNH